jgi:molecular chaperone IbpA
MNTLRRMYFDSEAFPTFSYDTLATIWTEQAKKSGTYPPYNLTKNSESTEFNLTLAVAGFGPEDIDVSVEDNQLIIKGKVEPKALESGVTYVHKGIAERTFTRTFTLGEHVEVKGVSYVNGLLDVHLALVLPEHKKPKKFVIEKK